MGRAEQVAEDYRQLMAEVIAFAEACSDADWQTLCPNEERSVGVVFDHIAVGNRAVQGWARDFLGGRPVRITQEQLTAENAAHAREVKDRPRAETLRELRVTAQDTAEFLDTVTDEQLELRQEFGWAGQQNVEWVLGAALRHPRNHFKSIRAALDR